MAISSVVNNMKSDLIKCAICGNPMRQMSKFHLMSKKCRGNELGIQTMYEYRAFYPDSPTVCDSLRKEHSERFSRTVTKCWTRQEHRDHVIPLRVQGMLDFYKDLERSAETRRTIGLWTTDRNLINWQKTEYQEARKATSSKTLTKLWNTQPDVMNAHLEIARIIRWLDPGQHDAQSLLMCDINRNFSRYHRMYSDLLGRVMKFKSSWELGFAMFLDQLGIKYDYESRTFKIDSNRRYTPDFRLCDNQYVEVKGYVTDQVHDTSNKFRSVTNNSLLLADYDVLESLGVFDLIPRKPLDNVIESFNDYPLWSTDKRQEARRYLDTLGIRYSLSSDESQRIVEVTRRTQLAIAC